MTTADIQLTRLKAGEYQTPDGRYTITKPYMTWFVKDTHDEYKFVGSKKTNYHQTLKSAKNALAAHLADPSVSLSKQQEQEAREVNERVKAKPVAERTFTLYFHVCGAPTRYAYTNSGLVSCGGCGKLWEGSGPNLIEVSVPLSTIIDMVLDTDLGQVIERKFKDGSPANMREADALQTIEGWRTTNIKGETTDA